MVDINIVSGCSENTPEQLIFGNDDVWRGSNDSVVLPAGGSSNSPAVINVDPLGGSVIIQFRDSSGVWVTPDAEEYTITSSGPIQLERVNSPPARISAVGAAKFKITTNS